MRHSLRIALYTLAAVFPCKAFDGLPESAKSPESWEHVFQSHLLSPSNPPPAHSFNSQQPGSVARLLSDHLYFNLPPADPSFHAGTDYAPNFPFHPGLHQDRGEPPSGFLPAPANFDEPPRLNTVAWEGPHQSCQTGPHNFAAYPNSVWSSHFPSHLSLHPVGTEPVRDPEPLPLVHSSEQEAFHNTDQHPTSRVLTASESTSNSHQLSRSSDGVPALKSRTRRRKSPEPPVQLRAPPPAGTRSHGLPIESFTKTYFKQPDAKLVITLHEYSDDHLLLFDEKEFRTFYSKPLKSKGSKVAGVEPQQQVDSVDAFLPNSKAWLTYWHRRSEVDPRQYLQRVTWCEAEPIFPLFLIYVELITAFLWEPNPKDYAEEFKQRCELFVKEANRMKPSTPSSLSSVQAQGPKNSSSTKKMKTPKCPTPLAKQPMRYVNVVWKLIFCWARDYRPTLLTINRARQCIIPKALKAFINGVFVASTEKLTQSTCELVGLPHQS